MLKYHLQAMDMIKAREKLDFMDAVTYPMMTKKDRRSYHRKIVKAGYPDNFKKRALKTTDLELV